VDEHGCMLYVLLVQCSASINLTIRILDIVNYAIHMYGE